MKMKNKIKSTINDLDTRWGKQMDLVGEQTGK